MGKAGTTIMLSVGAALALLLAGCPSAKDEAKQGASKGSGSAMRTITSTPDLIAKGKATFGACAGCHGANAEGRVGIGPRLASKTYLEAASDDFLRKTIKNGRAGTTMIAWGTTYDDKQIDGVIAYLRSLQPSEPATLDESPLQADIALGEKTFRNVCSGCHGHNGGGFMETANGTGIGRKAFLDTASNGFIRHIVRNGKSLTKMRGFALHSSTAVANLSDKEIDSVIGYLRTKAW